MQISRDEAFAQTSNGFKISPYLQNLLLATCAENPYHISQELLSLYLGIDISDMQLYRITDHYGSSLSTVLQNNPYLHPLEKKEDVVYAMADGSMVLTREEQWKEAKLGRIFIGQDCLHAGDKPGRIIRSQYVSHFGDSGCFTEKMEKVLDDYGRLNDRLIFITDGAVWLRKWIQDAYPEAVSILDFYHAKEYLCDVAKEYFEEAAVRKNWTEEQAALLLQSGAALVIKRVQALAAGRDTPAADKLITYYRDNLSRMDYQWYQKMGKGLIGSGAMESSHKTVIQCRMKRSGQRWSKKGATHMLCLRTIKMNQQWDKVVDTIKAQYARPKAA